MKKRSSSKSIHKSTISEVNEMICDFYGEYYREIEKVIGSLTCDPYYDFMRLLQAYPSKLKDAPGDSEDILQLKADFRRWLRRYRAWRKVRERIDAGSAGSEEHGED